MNVFIFTKQARHSFINTTIDDKLFSRIIKSSVFNKIIYNPLFYQNITNTKWCENRLC